jgi:hypothetical protein
MLPITVTTSKTFQKSFKINSKRFKLRFLKAKRFISRVTFGKSLSIFKKLFG